MLLKTIGSHHHIAAAQTERWIQAPTGTKPEEASAAENSLASYTLLQDYSLFLLFSLTGFSYRYLSLTLLTYLHKKKLNNNEKKYSKAPSI